MNTDTPRTDQAVLQSDGQWSFVLRGCSQELERELTAVTEQRDGLRSGIDYASDQLTKVTEQRDRLAEAMQTIIRIYENADKGCIPSSSDMYDEALQSLTPD
jgi:uncharacterized coiled-coil DUF342 family protein